MSTVITLSLPLALCLSALGQDSQSQGPPVVAGSLATNGPSTEAEQVIAQINTELGQVKDKLTAAAERMKAVDAASHVDHALAITNAARQIRELAQTDLAENGPIAMQADRLIKAMKALEQEGNDGMNNPSTPGAEIYANGISAIRTALAKLLDKRASLENVRQELLRKATALEGRAKAIDWLTRCQQADLAAKAFCDAVDDVLAYAQRLGVVLNRLGGKAPPLS